MIIDVVDLKFETLQFNRRYDPSRYKRGKNIYNNGDAIVTKVNKIDDKNYSIEASVEGNYDTYTTSLGICGNMINKSTCTCEDYYKGNLCKHIIATSMEVIEPHYASTIEGRRKIEEKKKEEERRRLEEIKARQEEERKRREYERKYYSGLRTIELYKQNTKKRLTCNLDLYELYESTSELRNKKTGEIATSIKLEYFVEIEDPQTLKLSFKIGQTRMYVLNNICDFYEAYQNESELYYGKQLRFIPKRENFTEDSQIIFDYIIKYAEMVDYNNKHSDYATMNSLNKAIYLSGNNIDEFFGINKNKAILMKSYYGNTKYEFTDQKLDISCVLTKEKVQIPNYNYWYYYDNQELEESEEYVLKLNIQDYLILETINKIHVFYQNKIYTMEKEKNLIKIFEMFEKQDKILIPEDKLGEFEKIVLPQIKLFKIENLPVETVKEALVVNKLASKILLDTDEQGNILLELKFCYMDYEFNVLKSGYKTYVKQII